MKYTTAKLGFLALALTALLSVHGQDQPYYINRAGRKVEVEGLTADEQGNLKVALGGGATQTVRRTDYRFAYVPKPQKVAQLEQAFLQENYDFVLNNVQPVFDQYKYLGWGGRLYYLKGQAELAKGQYETANRTFDVGLRFTSPDDRELLQMGKVEALLELERDDQADELLDELKTAESDRVAAFSFMAQGKLLARQGRNDEAILEFLKTVLLFEPKGQIQPIHEEARWQVVALLKAKGDPAYKRFENNQ